jgi:methyl-accepting chemotaxis protein
VTAIRATVNNLTIATKLRAAFLIMVGLSVAFGAFAIQRMSSLNRVSTEMEANWMPGIVATSSINTAATRYRLAQTFHVVARDEAEMFRREQDMDTLSQAISDWGQKYERVISTRPERERFDEFVTAYERYLLGSRKIVALSRAMKKSEAFDELQSTDKLFVEMNDNLVKLVEINQEEGIAASERGTAILSLSAKILMAAIVVMVVLALLLMWFFERSTTRPVAEVSRAIERLAAGDLDVFIHLDDRGDEVGQLTRAAYAIANTIKILVGDLRQLVDAAESGTLSIRVDAGQHQGEFGVLVAGMNQLFDSFTWPLGAVADVMNRAAVGDLQGRVEGEYQGDFLTLKDNVNTSLDALRNLLAEMSSVTDRLAIGDLSASVDGCYDGELAAIAINMNEASALLREVLVEIVADSQRVSTAATETAAAASEVATHSAKQLEVLNDISTALTQTAASVWQIAGNSEKGRELVKATSDQAEDGRQRLVQLVEAIERIAASNSRIGQISDRVSRIAEKTHVLSLNAGIEAARAGEHGLGFGIVAHQIGKLAEEVSAAVGDITALTVEASQNVSGGVAAAAETRTAIERIAEVSRESETTVQSIATAIMEQASSVGHLSHRVQDLQHSGENNATAAREINITMEKLSQLIHQLSAQIGCFTLG